VGVCREEPHELVPIPEDVLPAHGPEILGTPPDTAFLLAPLHPIHRPQPGDDPMELVHEHAEREDEGRDGDHQHRADEVGRESAVVVAVLLRDALDEVVEHQADGVARHREGVEEE